MLQHGDGHYNGDIKCCTGFTCFTCIIILHKDALRFLHSIPTTAARYPLGLVCWMLLHHCRTFNVALYRIPAALGHLVCNVAPHDIAYKLTSNHLPYPSNYLVSCTNTEAEIEQTRWSENVTSKKSQLQAKDVLPNIYCTDDAERAEKCHFCPWWP